MIWQVTSLATQIGHGERNRAAARVLCLGSVQSPDLSLHDLFKYSIYKKNVGYFSKSRYIAFTIHLDKYYSKN